MLALMRDMLRMPAVWMLWVALLALANVGGGLAFVATPEGRVVLFAFVVAAGLLMTLHARLGFVRLLGLAHVPWVPLVIWLVPQAQAAPQGSWLGAWVWSVVALNTVSLAIDAVDVVRYVRGERSPTIAP